MKTLVRQAMGAAVDKVRQAGDGTRELAPLSGRDVERFARAYGRRRGGKRLSKEHLGEVARIYREARASEDAALRRAPTVAVAEAMFASRPTAGRWVMAARRRGLLTD
jgi:hypothetical protein